MDILPSIRADWYTLGSRNRGQDAGRLKPPRARRPLERIAAATALLMGRRAQGADSFPRNPAPSRGLRYE